MTTKMISVLALAILVGVIHSNVSAAVIHSPGFDVNDATDAQHIALAAQPQFQASGWLTTFSGGVTTYASATLVSPQWVLTAAHNITSNPEGTINLPLGSIKLGFGASPLTDTTQYSITQIIRPPGYNPDNDVADLAFLKLATPITTIAPMPLFTSTPVDGTPATAIGYGQPGNPTVGLLPFDGVERGMINDIVSHQLLIDNFPTEKNLLMTEFWPNNDAGYYQSYGGNATAGDDGGGLMVLDNGTWKLAGVNAFEVNSPNYASMSLYTDISAYLPFISSQPALASILAPEPATMTLLAVGALSLLRRTRTRQ